ncbi:hypothetical protein FJZ36_00510 [Candidatus Poribacteria bacterium]|nr:hypothetical protein [Candidatus Poribacteria bacterium]
MSVPRLSNDAIGWLARRVAEASAKLPREFADVASWEGWRDDMRARLRSRIGVPYLEPTEEAVIRSDTVIASHARLERVDIPADADYAIPAFVVKPAEPKADGGPGIVLCPGWPQTKWEPQFMRFGERMARHGFVTAILDHAPFGETSHNTMPGAMTHVMGIGNLLGISQLALRAAEAMCVGEYLRMRDDVRSDRVAITGLCQGGMTTWMAGGLDNRFAAVAPVASGTTFTAWAVEMSRYRALGDVSPYPFGLIEVCDTEHLHAAVAPRPLLVQANTPDDWWPLSGFQQIESFSRQVYELYGAEERCEFVGEMHEHAITGPFADRLEAFLLKHLG